MLTTIVNGVGISTISELSPAVSGFIFWNADRGCWEIKNLQNNNVETIYNKYTEISLNSEVVKLLDWVKDKIEEERKLADLCRQYPVLDQAYREFILTKMLIESK